MQTAWTEDAFGVECLLDFPVQRQQAGIQLLYRAGFVAGTEHRSVPARLDGSGVHAVEFAGAGYPAQTTIPFNQRWTER